MEHALVVMHTVRVAHTAINEKSKPFKPHLSTSILFFFVRPPDLKVDEDTRDDPTEDDDSRERPQMAEIVDEDVSVVLWAFPDLHSFNPVLDCRQCHNAGENH